jgi:hypothetical protein
VLTRSQVSCTTEKNLLANFNGSTEFACASSVDHATIAPTVEKCELNEAKQAVLCSTIKKKVRTSIQIVNALK